MDRRIFANMDSGALWQQMQPCVQRIIQAYGTGGQMMENFKDVVRHARRLIQDTCERCGVAPHFCVCSVYCFMCKSGYYTVPQFQVMLAALVKGEAEIMAEEYARAHREMTPAVPTTKVVTGIMQAHQSVVVNNHHHAGDGKSMEALERKVDELMRLVSKGQGTGDAQDVPMAVPMYAQPAGGQAKTAPEDESQWIKEVLRRMQA